jgi:hypothetical protein
MATGGRTSDITFKTLTQNAKPVIDKDSNLTANTIIAEGDLYVLGNIYGGDAPSITTQDEGVTLSTAATTLNFVGAGVIASGDGAVTTVTIAGATPSTISTQDEGVALSSTVNTLNFVGAGVVASGAGSTTTVTIAGAGAATVTVQDEGVTTSATVNTINFVGAGLVASGAGATATVTSTNKLTVVALADADATFSPVDGVQYIANFSTDRTITFTAASLAGLGLAVGQSIRIPIEVSNGHLIPAPAAGSTVSGVYHELLGPYSGMIGLCNVMIHCTGVGLYTLYARQPFSS